MNKSFRKGFMQVFCYGLDDPYSRYYTAEEYDSENSSNEGSYVGIGSYGEEQRRRSKDC